MHRVNQGQQQDHNGKIWNIIAIYDIYGNKKTVMEAVEIDDMKEVVFDLRPAKGHKWYLTDTTMRVEEEHDAEECTVCAMYATKQQTLTKQQQQQQQQH